MGLYEFSPDDAFRFAREHGEYRARGDELQFKLCPYCGGGANHDKFTFSINLKTGANNCQRASCGRKGSMITLHRDFGFSLGDGIDAYYDRQSRFKSFARTPIKSKPEAVKYMESRGISQTVTEKYEITMHKEQSGVLVFPFRDEGGVLWFIKYRNTQHKNGDSGSKEWCERDRKPILFGMNHCNFKNPVLIMTEGQIDSLSLTEAGIENAVSVPTGKNGFTWVPHCWNFLGRFKELIIFGDNENGSVTLLEDMKTRFRGRIKCVRQEDYRGCKDANEILQKYGKAALVEAVQKAETLPISHTKCLRDIQRVDLSKMEHISTGIPRLDATIRGFYFGQVILLTGARGDGKSTLASQFATFAMKQGVPVYLYSGEMQDWLVRGWLDAQIVGPDYMQYNGTEAEIPADIYTEIERWEMYSKCWVYDDSSMDENEEAPEDAERETVLNTLENAVQQYGVRFAVIDNLMTAMDFTQSVDLNLSQTLFVKRLAVMAKKYNIIIMLIAHPKKMNGRTLTADDVSGSGNITNLVNTVLTYSRAYSENGEEGANADNGERKMTILKERFNGNTDHRGFKLYYNKASKRISDSMRFSWELGWEDHQFNPVDDDEVVF